MVKLKKIVKVATMGSPEWARGLCLSNSLKASLSVGKKKEKKKEREGNGKKMVMKGS
jgi:hypothetical protein